MNITISGTADSFGKFSSSSQENYRLAAGHWSQHFDPVILHPRPDTETPINARHRVNYPGEPYTTSIDVFGGARPFHFSLTVAPVGATIGSQLIPGPKGLVPGTNHGVVSWDNPTAGTHNFTVVVKGQSAFIPVELSVSWVAVVGTDGWLHFDSEAGVNGTGSEASPYNNLASLTDKTTANGVLFRSGTVDWEQKVVPMNRMPKNYLPFNGATVNMKGALSSIGFNGGNDYYFGGLRFYIPSDRTGNNQYFRIDGGPDRVTFFDCEFDGGGYLNTNTDPDEPRSNSSMIMWTDQHAPEAGAGNSWYNVIKNCRFKNIWDRDLVLLYSMRFTCIDGCTIENCRDEPLGQGFYVKTNVSDLTISNVRSIGNQNTQPVARFDAYTGDFLMNRYHMTRVAYDHYGAVTGDGVGAVIFGYTFEESGAEHFVDFCTLRSVYGSGAFLRGTKPNSVHTFDKNVIVCGGTNTNGLGTYQYAGTVTNTNYLAGNLASGIIDSDLKLTGDSADFIGTRGEQYQ